MVLIAGPSLGWKYGRSSCESVGVIVVQVWVLGQRALLRTFEKDEQKKKHVAA
jgi:hypothetical protein